MKKRPCRDCGGELERETHDTYDKKGWVVSYFCIGCHGSWFWNWEIGWFSAGQNFNGCDSDPLVSYYHGAVDDAGQVW